MLPLFCLMSIESGGGGQGEKPDDPKPPNHNQLPEDNHAKRDENRPFKLYKDAKSPTNWMLEAEVDGHTVRTFYHPNIHRFTRDEYIERIRKGVRIVEEHRQRQKPDQGSKPNQ